MERNDAFRSHGDLHEESVKTVKFAAESPDSKVESRFREHEARIKTPKSTIETSDETKAKSR